MDAVDKWLSADARYLQRVSQVVAWRGEQNNDKQPGGDNPKSYPTTALDPFFFHRPRYLPRLVQLYTIKIDGILKHRYVAFFFLRRTPF